MTFMARMLGLGTGFIPILVSHLAATTVSPATTSASGTGATATIGFAAQTIAPPVGSLVKIAGVTPTQYNGSFIVTASSTTSVSYTSTVTGAQTVAGTATIATRATETAPIGCSQVVIECFGADGGGGGRGAHGKVSPGTVDAGAGGGSGGYSKTTVAIVGGQTLFYIVGAGGAAGANVAWAGSGNWPGGDGTNSGISEVLSGSATITTMTAPGGGGGGGGGVAGGTAGVAGAIGTGGTNTNSVGNAGAAGITGTSTGGAGGAGVTGTNGNGTTGGTGGNTVSVGGDGAVYFYYT